MLGSDLDFPFILMYGINGIVLPFVRVSLLINMREKFFYTLSYDIVLSF